ncbi:hypothetical protein RSOLAG22IIIB_04413 [Rhizoctonia solani]|uniref:Uncharacterized protein n=1 Tax=Rhizoctonia solani TaxID=456999 RepID=A0A0K6FXM5_9AGAM|nr:hypothetical protein RSOLAG22IIIB_04413 [Rhizoctonia solani]
MIEELLQAGVYFPRIRHLEIGLHTLKPRSKPLSRVLKGYDKQIDHKTGSALNLELCVIERQEEHWTFNAEDWDFIARLLASCWSSISIKPSPIEELLERTFKVNEIFASHPRAGKKCREETP